MNIVHRYNNLSPNSDVLTATCEYCGMGETGKSGNEILPPLDFTESSTGIVNKSAINRRFMKDVGI